MGKMDASSAFGQRRGCRRDEFSRTPSGVAHRMSFALEVLVVLALPQSRIRYEVDIERSVEPASGAAAKNRRCDPAPSACLSSLLSLMGHRRSYPALRPQ